MKKSSDGMTMALHRCVRIESMKSPESAACHRCRGGRNRTDTWSCRHAIECGTATSFHAGLCAAHLCAALLWPRRPLRSVAEAEWDTFLRDVVVPRFPRGLTVTYAKGHWQAAGEPLQREASRVLEIMYDADTASRSAYRGNRGDVQSNLPAGICHGDQDARERVLLATFGQLRLRSSRNFTSATSD